MALNFPANPTDGQTFTFASIEYTYNLATDRWFVVGGTGGGGSGLTVADLVTGDLTVTGALEAAEAAIQQLFFIDATGGTLELSQQLQVGDLTISGTARPTSGSGLLAVGADGQFGGTVDPMNPVGTTVGDFAVGDVSQFLSWDNSEGELTIQGRITNVTQALLSGESLPSDTQTFNASQDITGLFGAGIYVAILWGGGGGGGANTNSQENTGRSSGGGAGGMAICAFDYDGTSTLNYTHGGGGGGASASARSAVSGNSGGTGRLTLGGSTIMQANGGGGGGSQNAASPGGTGTVNLVEGNTALFVSANSNSAKGSANNNFGGGGAGVVIPTIEAEDANLTGRNGSFSYGSAGGGMLSNQTGANGFTNAVNTQTPNYIAGFAAFPLVAGSTIGNGGASRNGGSTPSGDAGGRFCGGGGARTSFGSGAIGRAGAGNMGGGGGGGTGGRQEQGQTSGGRGGAGGAGGLIISRL